MSNYDFTSRIDRSNTGSLKWDKYRNSDILPFWVADMEFKAAPEIIEALQQRLNHSIFGYTIPYDSVVEAVALYQQRQHGYTLQPDSLLWTPGIVPALNLFVRAYTEPGDSIMTATPVYPPFLSAPGNSGRKLIEVPLTQDGDRETLDFEAMEKLVTPKTRAFILCNPHNPGGRVFTREELQKLADFCLRHKLILCSDEIHCDLILEPGCKHLTTAVLGKEIASQTVTLMSPSKTYNIPGLCCAYAIIENSQLRNRFKQAAQGIFTEINAFGYAACEAAYRHGENWRQELITVLRANRDRLFSFIKQEMPRIKMLPMEATYLGWMDVGELQLTDAPTHFEQHGIGLSDGSYFHGKHHLRINFGCPSDQLEEGLLRLKQGYDAIP